MVGVVRGMVPVTFAVTVVVSVAGAARGCAATARRWGGREVPMCDRCRDGLAGGRLGLGRRGAGSWGDARARVVRCAATGGRDSCRRDVVCRARGELIGRACRVELRWDARVGQRPPPQHRHRQHRAEDKCGDEQRGEDTVFALEWGVLDLTVTQPRGRDVVLDRVERSRLSFLGWPPRTVVGSRAGQVGRLDRARQLGTTCRVAGTRLLSGRGVGARCGQRDM